MAGVAIPDLPPPPSPNADDILSDPAARSQLKYLWDVAALHTANYHAIPRDELAGRGLKSAENWRQYIRYNPELKRRSVTDRLFAAADRWVWNQAIDLCVERGWLIDDHDLITMGNIPPDHWPGSGAPQTPDIEALESEYQPRDAPNKTDAAEFVALRHAGWSAFYISERTQWTRRKVQQCLDAVDHPPTTPDAQYLTRLYGPAGPVPGQDVVVLHIPESPNDPGILLFPTAHRYRIDVIFGDDPTDGDEVRQYSAKTLPDTVLDKVDIEEIRNAAIGRRERRLAEGDVRDAAQAQLQNLIGSPTLWW